MPKKMIQAWQCRYLLASTKIRSRGFTLLELLVAIIISGLVVSGLLYLVVELLRIDNREIALEEVQRDTQRALNYIAKDLEEAVYVYEDLTNPAPTVDPKSFVVDDTLGVGSALAGEPILAFWKVNSIEDGDFPPDCDANFSGKPEKINECKALKIRRGTYDLVVYTQISGASGSWEGRSRIARYELSQYTNPATLTESKGYVSPRSSSFDNWRKQADEAAGGSSSVLVDYISEPNFTTGTDIDCQVQTGSANFDDYVLSPPNAKADTNLINTSFFACVRNSSSDAPLNQDVYIFLKGDTTGRATSLAPASEASRFPILQTQVLVRGILDKSPAD